MSIPDTSIHCPAQHMEEDWTPHYCHLPSHHCCWYLFVQVFALATSFDHSTPSLGGHSMPDLACGILVATNYNMVQFSKSTSANRTAHSSATHDMVGLPVSSVGEHPMQNHLCSTSPPINPTFVNHPGGFTHCHNQFSMVETHSPSHTSEHKCQ